MDFEFTEEQKMLKRNARELPKLGICSCSAAELIFQHCPAPKENLISGVGKGYAGVVEMIADMIIETRDARTLIFLDGTTEIQKLIVGREVLGMSAFV